jgi:glycosyltransferase involved in cell wall biosynthesis
MPSKVLDIDLADGPPADIEGLTSYDKAFVLLRWHGRPIGRVLANLIDGRIAGTDLLRAASLELGKRLVLASLEDLQYASENGATESSLPSCSIVVCTRDRVGDLQRCIEALCVSASKNNNIEIIIVDNAPPNDGTAKLAAKYPVRYVCEERQGLNWARRRGALEALNEVVIYTDDDVIVDPLWVEAMRRPFVDPGISAVTGLILPMELETLAQEYFESHFSFCLGFERNEFKIPDVMAVMNGDVGVGASMAIRRSIINGLKLFDFEMDCGTITRSGGDTHAFYLLLSHGCRILYNPEALCWHRHRREIYELERTLFGYGTGFFVHLLRCLLQHGEMESLYAGYFIYKYWLEKLWNGLRGDPLEPPPNIMIQFIKGSLHAPWAYIIGRHRERAYLGGSGPAKAEGFCGSRN